jgi:DNA-directed RNA polymerase subunit RPC12/RpoP
MMTKTKPETSYTCKECGVPVKRERDEFVRGCECNGGIVASLHATAYGESKVAS